MLVEGVGVCCRTGLLTSLLHHMCLLPAAGAASIQRRPSPTPTTNGPCTSSNIRQEGSTGAPEREGCQPRGHPHAGVLPFPNLPPLSTAAQQQQHQMQHHFPMAFLQPPMPLAFAM